MPHYDCVMRPRSQMVDVRPAGVEDKPYILRTLTEAWSSTVVVGHGVVYDAATLPGFIAVADGERAGLLTYHVDGTEWEIVTLNATVAGRGVGTALLHAAEAAAREDGARRLWLITTNDNTRALRFYQRRGFDLVAIHRDAVTRSRAEFKPSIPEEVDGIPLRHELELERLLT